MQGLATGFSVLDDFLPWEGIPFAAVTILEGPQSVTLARKLVSRLQAPQRAVWIHSLRQRPFFLEGPSCFRLQVPDDPEILKILPEILRSAAFTTAVVQVSHPLSRARALELFKIVENTNLALILVCKHPKSFPSELAKLVVDAHEDFLCVRKAECRQVPFWIPVGMLELNTAPSDLPVISCGNAFESFYG